MFYNPDLKINIIDIVKELPQGTILYSPIYGELELHRVDEDYHCIECWMKDSEPHIEDFLIRFNAFGNLWDHLGNHEDAECVLFPSKTNRDWTTFGDDLKDRLFIPKASHQLTDDFFKRNYFEKDKIGAGSFPYRYEDNDCYIVICTFTDSGAPFIYARNKHTNQCVNFDHWSKPGRLTEEHLKNVLEFLNINLPIEWSE